MSSVVLMELDGNDGLSNPIATAANVPIEVAESEFPIIVERYGLVPDSGGAGKFRSGLRLEKAWRPRVPPNLLVRSDRQRHAPYGLAGGQPGGISSNTVHRSNGTRYRSPRCLATYSQATSSTTTSRPVAVDGATRLTAIQIGCSPMRGTRRSAPMQRGRCTASCWQRGSASRGADGSTESRDEERPIMKWAFAWLGTELVRSESVSTRPVSRRCGWLVGGDA